MQCSATEKSSDLTILSPSSCCSRSSNAPIVVKNSFVHLTGLLPGERRTAKHKKCQTRFFAHIFSCNSPRHLRYTTKVSGSGEEKNGKKTIRFFSINGLDRDPKLTITHSFIPFTFPFFSCVSECHCPTALLFTPYIWRRIESGGFKRIPECNDQRTGSVLSPLGHAVPWSVYL